MNRTCKILWGLVFIIIGIIIATNALELTFINLFFKGWWTLLIIIPCFIGLFEEKGKLFNLIGLAIGAALLCAARNWISFSLIFKMLIPVGFIWLGLYIAFGGKDKDKNKKTKEKNKTENGIDSIGVTFSEQTVNKENEEFKGAILDSVFGKLTLDLRKAKIENGATINSSSIFGATEILLPKGINVNQNSTPIFGGVKNNIVNSEENKKTIYIESFCLFGGTNIK